MNILSGGHPFGGITSNVAATPSAMASNHLSLGLFSGAYHGAGSGRQELSGWHPSLRSSDSELIPARDKIVARSRDLDRNNGWAQGGINKRVEAVVGSNIRLRARPDFHAMGLSAEWADEFSRQVEALFRTWANDPRMLNDVERRQHFGGQAQLAFRHFAIDGEAAAPIFFINDRGGMFSTALLVLDPDRISNKDNAPDGERLRGGVELDQYGADIAYWVRKGHPNDISTVYVPATWERIPREGPTGRPMFVHVINKRRAHQHRSIGVLSSVMGRMRMLDSYDANELKAAIANAVFGLYVKSAAPTQDVADALAPSGDTVTGTLGAIDAYAGYRAEYHATTDVAMDGVRLAHLLPGEDVKAISAERPATNFAAFENAVLGSIAAPLGISREQLSQDWTGINYSSARTLLNEIWRGIEADRHSFTQAFCTPVYSALLEEWVARDMIEIPGGKAMFYTFRSALTQCQWLGPARGYVDPLKEAKAAEVRMALGISSLTDECADQGRDADEVRWQRKRDMEQDIAYRLSAEASTGDVDQSADPDADPDDVDRVSLREAA